MEGRPSPTIQHLARKAGVSMMTISRALRNLPGVSEKLRFKIKKLAEEEGYRPNPLVSALFSRINSNKPASYQASLAVLTSWGGGDPKSPRNWAPRLIWKGAQERAARLGYQLEEFSWDFAIEKPDRLDRILKARGIHGIMIMPCLAAEGKPLPGLDWSKYALAGVFHSTSLPSIPRVGTDEVINMKKVMVYLKGCGYQRIGITRHRSEDVRSQGLMRAVYDFEMASCRPQIPVYNFSVPDPFISRFKKWILSNRVEAVVASSGMVWNLVQRAGLCIPQDVALFLMDWTSGLFERCAGLDLKREAIGAGAVDLLVEQLNSNQRGFPKDLKFISIESMIRSGMSAPNRSSIQ